LDTAATHPGHRGHAARPGGRRRPGSCWARTVPAGVASTPPRHGA